ncbi:uncharacterized protein [Solanum lycopersicum]|uniref:uncharacterized protein n=1 Tax=Solanum lycopersicum TaxID=4081 RepID=UPI000532CCC3|nr:uncharacterized protein LOC104647588 [Solanum lycopersicum]XP_025886780.1 uncharacterized protein LOC104647588 [Solanum lycopersicum]
MVWGNYLCDYCARFIRPYYYGDLVCCNLCGKVLDEDKSKEIDPAIEKTYEETIENDVEYGKDTTYTEIREEYNSRRVWCNHCVKSISQPHYFVNKICCSICGKVLEDNIHFITR